MTEVHETRAGDNLNDTIIDVITRANEIQGPVRFEFNGANVTVTPDLCPDQVEAEVRRQWDAARAAYLASPRGQEDARQARERLEQCQKEHDELITTMEEAFKQNASTMKWLSRYADAADHIGVKGINHRRVIRALEAEGFARNDQTGLALEDYKKPHILALYIAGQALDCMYAGHAPHPVIQKFVKDYWNLVA